MWQSLHITTAIMNHRQHITDFQLRDVQDGFIILWRGARRGQKSTCQPLAACVAAYQRRLVYICQHLSFELRHVINVSGSMARTSCFLHHNLCLLVLDLDFVCHQKELQINYFCSDPFCYCCQIVYNKAQEGKYSIFTVSTFFTIQVFMLFIGLRLF